MNPSRQLFKCRVKEVMSNNNHDLWGSSKEGVLKAYNEIYGYKQNMKCNVNTWWWNSGTKDEIQKKKRSI